MCRTTVLVAILLPLIATGCGGEDPAPTASRTPAATPSPTAEAEATPTVDPFSDQAAADLATDYVAAIKERDWGKACALHNRRIRREFARLGGCEAGLGSFWRSNRRLRSYLVNASAGEVRRRGSRAVVEFSQTFAPKLGVNFVAVKERGRWRLDDMKPPTAD